MKRALLALAAMTIASILPSALAQSPAPETARTIAQGDLTGFIADSGAHAWLNVPFAADTGGENRWRAPRPAANWDGTRDAVAHGPRCPQIANGFTMSEEPFEPGDLLGDEACLNLDIYAPADAAGKTLPVMMWIHGGSNVSGTTADYDGAYLAQNENVIVVAVQYRLGPLGFFSHPALRQTATALEDRAANFATLDLIAALKWIKANAADFGGDANNVTVFGESAGGQNVATLLGSPLAKGLFHRAIIQSGGFDSVSAAEAEGQTGSAPNSSADVAGRLGGAENFHTATTAEIFDAFELDNGIMELSTIIQDGVTIPSTPLREAFSSTATFNAVPIITGTNRDEMKLFQAVSSRFTRRRLGRFIVARDKALYAASSDYGSRVWRIRSVDLPAAQMAAAGHDQVYAYRFDWDDGGRIFISNLKQLLGASHGMEIPFVFNRFQLLGAMDNIMFQKKTFENRNALSRTMGTYWANFARTGNPGSASGLAWPAYVSGGDALVRLDSVNDGGIELMQGADSYQSVLKDIKTDKRLSQKERCFLATNLNQWLPGATADLGCGA